MTANLYLPFKPLLLTNVSPSALTSEAYIDYLDRTSTLVYIDR